ncbi:peptidyl-prolyl cis-trans isomerase cyp15 protein [Rutstroemia sp. NJR-2017a BBW]|nr:peptidyl-prolyl cis-trans isomerase cyp15 protein [Rutstroemia sp. NJR-2017a BBW]
MADSDTGLKSNKRKIEEDDQDDSSSDDDMGPQLPSAEAPKKKRRKLPYEKLYISALPKSARYSKSLMHKEQLAFLTMTPLTDFLITSSVDGVVKFWKKGGDGIEFVKEFRTHVGEIKSVSWAKFCDSRSRQNDQDIRCYDVRPLVNVDIGVYPKMRLLDTSTWRIITTAGSVG